MALLIEDLADCILVSHEDHVAIRKAVLFKAAGGLRGEPFVVVVNDLFFGGNLALDFNQTHEIRKRHVGAHVKREEVFMAFKSN